MATIEDSINTYILAQSSITAYVGIDIYHCAAPDGIETDFIRYQVISPANDPYAFGNTNTAQPEIQFDIFSKNDASCLAIGNLLATALNRFSGSMGSSQSNVIYSTASGPMIMRDVDEQWYHGIVYWTPEYER